uniref:HDC10635 n=1 Tax=Drosophila melanogaster TaxID=7227 RepID=Q6IL23_DROME|nr:TPA_inf: HDC10635 [Drosophila melanogaster]
MPGKRLIFYDLNNDEDSRQPQLELQVPQLMMRIEIMVIMTRAGMWGRVGRPSSTCFGRNREEKLAEEASHPDIGDDKRSPARRLKMFIGGLSWQTSPAASWPHGAGKLGKSQRAKKNSQKGQLTLSRCKCKKKNVFGGNRDGAKVNWNGNCGEGSMSGTCIIVSQVAALALKAEAGTAEHQNDGSSGFHFHSRQKLMLWIFRSYRHSSTQSHKQSRSRY